MKPFPLPLLLVIALQASLSRAEDAPASGETSKPPRGVILIFTDDQGYRDLGCFGSPDIRTPHLDRLAAEGMRFTDFYSASAVCSPSRAALMTGSYPPRVGVTSVLFPRHSIGLNPAEFTIAEAFRSRGYATGAFGKWHLGHLPEFLPTAHGFDTYFGLPYSNDMGAREKGINGVAGLDRAWKLREKAIGFWNVPLLRDEEIIERPVDQTTITRRITEEAIRFVRENRERPFFVYLPHPMPHIPLFVSEEFHVEDPRKAYRATIEEIDHSVGQIRKALREIGRDRDTLVIFTTDNGPWLGKKHHGGSALPLRDGKFSTHEGGMRVPAIFWWPDRIPAGKVCGEVAGTIDLLPTLAELIGAPLPEDRRIDGHSIRALLEGREGARSPHELYCYYRGNRLEAVRQGRWKLRLPGGRSGRRNRGQEKDGGPRPAELYDLAADISEKQDVAGAHPAEVKRLTELARQKEKELAENSRPVGRVEEDR